MSLRSKRAASTAAGEGRLAAAGVVALAARDDHLRAELSELLEGGGWHPTADAEAAAEALLVVWGDQDGLADVLAALGRSRPSFAAVLAPAERCNARFVRRLVLAGFSVVLASDRAADALLPAMLAARAGHLVVPRDVREAAAPPVLTVREKQVLGMVVLGLSNAEIAQSLYVTESTVKSHLSSAFDKLGVRSRNEAAEAILDPENGLGTGILRISDSSTGAHAV